MNKLGVFINLDIYIHMMLGALIRVVLIVYADYHDMVYEVPYTDVDYKVFSDAAQYVSFRQSPYLRQTYRYSPLIAYMLLPNLFLGKNFGKLLFSCFDILIAIVVRLSVHHQLLSTPNKKNAMKIANYCSLIWLYNPMSIAISTRGNADSVSCFFMMTSILYLQTDTAKGLKKCAVSGMLLGIAIHLRLYPIVFCFPMFLSLGKYKINRDSDLLESLAFMIPNRKQLTLAFSCLATLSLFIFVMYNMYGYEFIFETYLYHLFRKDTRHNFSVLFYSSYLSMGQHAVDMVKNLTLILEVAIFYITSLAFGSDPQTLPFALFTQAVVLVTYSSVMTSQYFIWFLSLLPLVVHNFKMKPSKALFLVLLWVAAQGGWLFFAYLLEFKNREVFIFIWLKGIIFFCTNIYILGQLIRSYTPGYGFGQMNLIENENNDRF